MGVRLALIAAAALWLAGCKQQAPAPAETAPQAQPEAPAKPATPAPPKGTPERRTAKESLDNKPNCGAMKAALYLGNGGWECAFFPWRDLKKGSTNDRCLGNAPACDHDQSPACGIDGKWFCFDPKLQDAGNY